MTTFDADFDYLALLGIDPADALRTPSALVDPIKAKKKEWTGQALNPLYQQTARTNLERAREFEAILSEPPALAAYVSHIKQARLSRRGEQEAALTPLIFLALGDGGKRITRRQRDLILKEAKAASIPESLVDEVLKARSITVADPRAVGTEKPKIPTQSPALDTTVVAEIQNWLKVLGKRSLYELLDLPNSSPPPRLVSQAQLLYYHWSKVLPKTNTTTAWEKTLQACLTYLKDVDLKARYDRALFNQRIQRMLVRIDLVLAGSDFGSAEQAKLVRSGVEDYGFTEELVQQCMAARMAEKGIAVALAPVAIHLQGQVSCRRCGAWNGPKLLHCRECGSSLLKKCENPSCQAPPMPVEAKVCPSCALPVARGVPYRTLLRLADAFLDSGNHPAAVSVCQRAEQIMPGEAIQRRLARSVQIRDLMASARLHASSKSWTAVRAVLKELLPLAPRATVSGVPDLEKLSAFMAEATTKLRSLPADTSPVETAKAHLGCLRRWTDCEESYQKALQCCTRIEREGNPRLASNLAARLLDIRPDDAALKASLERLEAEARRVEVVEAERLAMVTEYLAALRENRLFAAERTLQAIEASGGITLPAGADDLRARLEIVRRQLAEIKQLTAGPTRRDQVIDRYLELLGRCRDCREALLALQNVSLDPPEPPQTLRISREGNRRVLSWGPPVSGQRCSYVLQRSIVRPGSRQVDPPFQTIYEGEAPHFIDDEIAHDGVILRYMVHAVVRGKIEVDGSVVRTYEMASPPVAFPGVLIWQEVKNLKGARRDRALEITWYPPSGIRQVLIERWPGGPDDDRLGIAILPATAPDRLLDEGLGDGMVHTYRVSCLYDGPDGEFRTQGACLTDGTIPAGSRIAEAVIPDGVPTPSSNGL